MLIASRAHGSLLITEYSRSHSGSDILSSCRKDMTAATAHPDLSQAVLTSSARLTNLYIAVSLKGEYCAPLGSASPADTGGGGA